MPRVDEGFSGEVGEVDLERASVDLVDPCGLPPRRSATRRGGPPRCGRDTGVRSVRRRARRALSKLSSRSGSFRGTAVRP